MQNTNQEACSRCAAARREFLTRSAVGGLAGAAAVGLPAVVGVSTMFQPLIGGTGHDTETEPGATDGGVAVVGTEVRLASLASLPEDGSPQRAVVYLDKIDGWNRTPNQPVGSVWLRRIGESVQAFHLSCPHAGCGIQYNTSEKIFYCPCHGATFDLDGVRRESPSESPRDLDTLEVRLDGDSVYVAFQDFGFGTAKKEAI